MIRRSARPCGPREFRGTGQPPPDTGWPTLFRASTREWSSWQRRDATALEPAPASTREDVSGDGVRNPRGALSWVSQWQVRICGSPWMAGRSACAEAHRPQAPPAERRAGRRGRNCRVARNARSGAASARHGQRPPLGGETTVARRTLRDPAARAPRAKGWAWQPNAASAERGPSWPLAATKGASRRPPVL